METWHYTINLYIIIKETIEEFDSKLHNKYLEVTNGRSEIIIKPNRT